MNFWKNLFIPRFLRQPSLDESWLPELARSQKHIAIIGQTRTGTNPLLKYFLTQRAQQNGLCLVAAGLPLYQESWFSIPDDQFSMGPSTSVLLKRLIHANQEEQGISGLLERIGSDRVYRPIHIFIDDFVAEDHDGETHNHLKMILAFGRSHGIFLHIASQSPLGGLTVTHPIEQGTVDTICLEQNPRSYMIRHLWRDVDLAKVERDMEFVKRQGRVPCLLNGRVVVRPDLNQIANNDFRFAEVVGG